MVVIIDPNDKHALISERDTFLYLKQEMEAERPLISEALIKIEFVLRFL